MKYIFDTIEDLEQINSEYDLSTAINLFLQEIVNKISMPNFELTLDENIKKMLNSKSFLKNNNFEHHFDFVINSYIQTFNRLQSKYRTVYGQVFLNNSLSFIDFSQRKYSDGLFMSGMYGRLNDKPNGSNQKKLELKKEDKTWFKIGRDFANGKIFELHNKNFSYSEISRQLYESDKYKNYISESLSSNPSNMSKCILKNSIKMNQIKEYFEKNNLQINEIFLEYLNKI